MNDVGAVVAFVATVVAVIIISANLKLLACAPPSRIVWRPLPGFQRAQYAVTPGFEVAGERIAEALRKCVEALATHTNWSPVDLIDAAEDSQVGVGANDTWIDEVGRRVAGLQENHRLYVGHNLEALCHEFAHLAGQRINGDPDELHSRWISSGIASADDAFLRWLRGAR